MKRIKRGILVGLMLALGSQRLRSDEFPIVDGRVGRECPVVELKLTKRQTKSIEGNFTSGMILVLTDNQIRILKASAKIKIAPTRLKIYKADELKGSCTCALANFALPFKPGFLEVPVGYLCSDKDAKDREITD